MNAGGKTLDWPALPRGPSMVALPLTTEEDCIGLATGAWLGGERAALLMQSSGTGN